MLKSQTCPCFGCQIVPMIGMRSPSFQLKRFARSTPTTAPWRSAFHAAICSGGSLNSGYIFMNGSGSTAIWAKKFAGSW